MQKHPKLIDPTFLLTSCRDSVEHCERWDAGPLEYERGFTIYVKSEGELNVRPQLFPKCFIMALSLAKTTPSWANLTTKITLDPASDAAAAAIVSTPGPRLTEIGEDGEELRWDAIVHW